MKNQMIYDYNQYPVLLFNFKKKKEARIEIRAVLIQYPMKNR